MHIRDKSIARFIITVDSTNVTGRKIRGFTEKQPMKYLSNLSFDRACKRKSFTINSSLLTDAHARVRISLHETCCARRTPETRVVLMLKIVHVGPLKFKLEILNIR